MMNQELKEFKNKYEKVPVELFENNVDPSPKVTVFMMAYQHGDYIEKAIRSVLAQKTNFSFEILIIEDDSKDETYEIAKKLAIENPTIIRLYKNSRANNIKVNGQFTGRFSFLWGMLNANGEYLAWLDGDDYWTDENKLQKQVELLEADRSLDLVVTRFHKSSQTSAPAVDLFGSLFNDKNEPVYFDTNNFFDRFYARPSTAVFRTPKTIKWFTKYKQIRGNSIFYEVLKNGAGKGVLLPDFTAFYRIHGGGVYSGLTITDKKFLTFETKYDVYLNNKEAFKNTPFHKLLKAEARYFFRAFLKEGKMKNAMKVLRLYFTL